MHIELHIFTGAMHSGPSVSAYREQMSDLMARIAEHILIATCTPNGGAIGKTTMLDEESGYIVATIDIRRE